MTTRLGQYCQDALDGIVGAYLMPSATRFKRDADTLRYDVRPYFAVASLTASTLGAAVAAVVTGDAGWLAIPALFGCSNAVSAAYELHQTPRLSSK